MRNRRENEEKSLGKRLASLHNWNAVFVALLALSGLMLFSDFWKEVLGGAKVWLKWLHIIVGLASIVPVFVYLKQAAKHWKQLDGKSWQRFNVIATPLVLMSWFITGVLLWQFNTVGPAVSNAALLVHDLLTWIGLPYLVYHSLSRLGQLKEPPRRLSVLNKPRPAIYTRKAFIRTIIGAGLTISIGPSLIKWLAKLGSGQGLQSINQVDANNLIPAPPTGLLPLMASWKIRSPGIGNSLSR